MIKVSGTTGKLNNYGTLSGTFVGLGADASNVTAGNTVTVTVAGGTNEQQSGLVIGANYFIDEFGTLFAHGSPDINQVNIRVGTAVSATKMLITNDRAWSIEGSY